MLIRYLTSRLLMHLMLFLMLVFPECTNRIYQPYVQYMNQLHLISTTFKFREINIQELNKYICIYKNVYKVNRI